MNTAPAFDPLILNAQALLLRSQRQEILASNLANADTPGYQARDIDFASVLQARLQGLAGSDTLPLAATDRRHLAGVVPLETPGLKYRTALQPAIDGNTVDADVERAHFAENTLGFEAAAALLQQTIRARQIAITGQP